MDKNALTQHFTQAFGEGESKIRHFFAPGRVNLIGEHTDYNGGHVFPCALNIGTYGAARKRGDNTLRLVSGNEALRVETPLDGLSRDATHGWANYVKGVVWAFLDAGHTVGGFDLYVWGDMPNAAGLSSSASLEMLTAVTLNDLFDCRIPPTELAILSRKAENAFVGVNCGIMDPFVIAMAKANHAILLNCQTLAHTHVPLALDGHANVIINTNKKRGLGDSKYHERQGECQAALGILKQYCAVDDLCGLTVEAFEEHKYTIKDETLRKRAEHAVYENARALSAVNRLTAGDLRGFGVMMNQSHISLRDLYEVTGVELDTLAEAAWKCDGTLGARMTGAGFGGCTVNLVRKDLIDAFIYNVGNEYFNKIGYKADFYITETGNGAGRF
jgi:galactokinase